MAILDIIIFILIVQQMYENSKLEQQNDNLKTKIWLLENEIQDLKSSIIEEIQ